MSLTLEEYKAICDKVAADAAHQTVTNVASEYTSSSADNVMVPMDVDKESASGKKL